ncbi:hypothetical protein [Paenibacillus sp. DRB1-1]|uniref:hypothetical protein n=1 Tax=Paenibacillus sp. DRB1-1 TaxID=3422309 RepID=UPI003F9841A6
MKYHPNLQKSNLLEIREADIIIVNDEQEVQLIEGASLESYQECRTITLTVFDDEVLRGVVASIDKPSRRIKVVRGEEDYSFIKLVEIISASI